VRKRSALLLLPLLCHAASAATFPITSNFDDGQAADWVQMNVGGDPLELLAVDYAGPGEDTPPAPAPGAGLLSFYDMDPGDWGFVSTTRFAGDLSAAFGGSLSFTQRWGTRAPGPDPTENFTANVIFGGLDDDGDKIAIVNFNPTILARDDLHAFSKPLDTSGGWLWVDEFTAFGPPDDLTPATAAQIKQVLSKVTFLYILGEFFTGDDRGYLDNVALTAPAALALAAEHLADGTVALRISGVAGMDRVVIQASENLRDWTEIHHVVPTGNVVNYVDRDAPGCLQRFYRAGP
jgi:hypothetical protein